MTSNALCPYCDSPDKIQQFSVGPESEIPHYLCQCVKCSAYYLDPMPTSEVLAAAYNEAYYGSGRKKFPGIVGFIFDWLRFLRAKRIGKLIKPSSNVLDIGCGSGVFLEGLKKLGHQCHGVELPGPAAKRASKIEGMHLYVGDIASVDLPANHFDFIMLWHVLEHLPNPRQALEVVSRSLRVGGIATIALPNIRSVQSRIFRAKWFHFDFPRHLTFLSSDSLSAEMQSRGLEVIYRRNFSLEYDPFGYQQSFLSFFGGWGALLYEMMKGNTAALQKHSFTTVLLLRLYLILSLPFGFFLAISESLAGSGGSIELGFKKIS